MEEPHKPTDDERVKGIWVSGCNLANAPLSFNGVLDVVIGASVVAEKIRTMLVGERIIPDQPPPQAVTADDRARLEQDLADSIKRIELKERHAAEVREAAARARHEFEVLTAKADVEVKADVELFGWM